MTATEAMQAAIDGKSSKAKDEAIEFLKELLKDAKDANEAAAENKIADRTLKRAKSELGVKSTKDGVDDGYCRPRLKDKKYDPKGAKSKEANQGCQREGLALFE